MIELPEGQLEPVISYVQMIQIVESLRKRSPRALDRILAEFQYELEHGRDIIIARRTA